MKINKYLILVSFILLTVALGVFVSKGALAKSTVEMQCQPINWSIGNRLHEKKNFTYQYDDNTVRCENSEVICYIYHGQLSCIKN